jgi:Protein of unknown function (DUF3455)
MTTKENSHPDVPDNIKAPAGEQLVFKAHASGSQIYVCQQEKGGKLAWILKAPEADLWDDQGNIIGYHFAGPSWRHADGSEVTGKAVARVDAPDSGSIPWLLINAVGFTGRGIFTGVTTIQRLNTMGGLPPATTECSASKENTEVKIGYTADYYFYAPVR